MQLFDESQKKMEDCYQAFPNKSYTCWFFDTQWQQLLKAVAANFFDDHYSYHSGSSTLIIKPSFIETICNEISNVYLVAMEKQHDFKIALLTDAGDKFNALIIRVRGCAAKNNVLLPQAPGATIFSPPEVPTIYHLYQIYVNDRLNSTQLPPSTAVRNDEEIKRENSYACS